MSAESAAHQLPPDVADALDDAAHADRLLVVCDFDGTIAPIVDDPWAATPAPDAVRQLVDLAALPRTTVALVSGRSRAVLADLSGVAPGSGVHLVGGHGAEHDGAEPADRAAVSALVAAVHVAMEPYAGVELEAKEYGVAVHVRRAVDVEGALDAVLSLASERGAHVLHGKRVVELSVVAQDKGSAVRRLVGETGADRAVIVGDDLTDESSFLAARLEDVTIKVGEGDTAARHRVDGVAEVVVALRRLAVRRAARLSSPR